MDKKKPRVNREIRVSEVRVIDAEGEQVGVMPTSDALKRAEDAGLDLVEVSPNAKPPVCTIVDYGKYQYQQKKRAAEAKKKQVVTKVKEVKFRPVTEEGDYQVKLRNLIRFLEHGDKVKVTIRFRGREMSHQELGRDLLARVREDAAEYGTVEQMPQVEGRQMVMVIGPKRKK
ncbi:MAG: translation initiation factor IF-3 [Legionellales bacterium]|nr:translation initiation factor IF-3 [Legionellales bacterium]|tara:strand:- start:13164 stop:13682 length:519 start_codon:yes stop_codon:yes gene_type:complete